MNEALVAHLRSRMSDIKFTPRKVASQPNLIGFMECRYDLFMGEYFTWRSIGLHTEDRKSYWLSWAKATMKSGEFIYANCPSPELDKACTVLFIEAMLKYYEVERELSAPQKIALDGVNVLKERADALRQAMKVPGQQEIKSPEPTIVVKEWVMEYPTKVKAPEAPPTPEAKKEEPVINKVKDPDKLVHVQSFWRRYPNRQF